MHGVFTALVTPFAPDLELDLDAFRKLLADQKAAGVAGVVPCGTTGESPTLSGGEKRALIRTALDELKGSGVRVVAGTGSNDTRETVELSAWASEQGVDGVLVVTPYYNKPSQAGLEAHFRAVADSVKCEVMLYNVPGRTGVSLGAETVARLARHGRIRSLKEATGDAAFASEVLDRVGRAGESFALFSGDDATYLPLLSVGAAGVVSVASNLIPRSMVALQKAFDQGDTGEALRLHQRFYPLFRDLFVEPNPVPVKRAMERAGFGSARTRQPLAALSPDGERALLAALERCALPAGATA